MKKLESINQSLFSSFEKDEAKNLNQIFGGNVAPLGTCNNGCGDRYSTTNSEGRGDGTLTSLDAC